MAKSASPRSGSRSRLISAPCIAMLTTLALGSPAYPAGSFTSQQLAGRTYKLYVPGGYVAGQPVPLVVCCTAARRTLTSSLAARA